MSCCSAFADPSWPEQRPFWFPPGGGVEDGEELVHAARREVREEVGIELAALGDVVATRQARFGFEGRHYEQDEHYYCVSVPMVRVARSLDRDRTAGDRRRAMVGSCRAS